MCRSFPTPAARGKSLRAECLKIRRNCYATAKPYSLEILGEKILSIYKRVQVPKVYHLGKRKEIWRSVMGRVRSEIALLKNIYGASEAAVKESIKQRLSRRRKSSLLNLSR